MVTQNKSITLTARSEVDRRIDFLRNIAQRFPHIPLLR